MSKAKEPEVAGDAAAAGTDAAAATDQQPQEPPVLEPAPAVGDVGPQVLAAGKTVRRAATRREPEVGPQTLRVRTGEAPPPPA